MLPQVPHTFCNCDQCVLCVYDLWGAQCTRVSLYNKGLRIDPLRKFLKDTDLYFVCVGVIDLVSYID
jgi:hypothetical protein